MLALCLTAPPAQGLTIAVPKPEVTGATAADAEAVQAAVKKELEGQGYGVVTKTDVKRSASVSGSLTKRDGGYVVDLAITFERDGRVLEHVREEAKTPADLPRASAEGARQLASALRLATGVRAKVKLK
ncbi:MAG: hypothetical protein JNJ54_32455 [Myxococcaceae bacterium]|nr:hypothetical protein [Myxococcaceae bacterium]